MTHLKRQSSRALDYISSNIHMPKETHLPHLADFDDTTTTMADNDSPPRDGVNSVSDVANQPLPADDRRTQHLPTFSFLALPDELQIEVLSHVLDFGFGITLDLIHEVKADGSVYIDEETYGGAKVLKLCRALPMLQAEILSIYYRVNSFRINVGNPKLREAFRDCIQRRAKLLIGLRALQLDFKIYHEPRGWNRNAVRATIPYFQISCNANGEIFVSYLIHRSRCLCGFCCRLCHQDYCQRVKLEAFTLHKYLEDRPQAIDSPVNQVVHVALAFCRDLDAVAKGGMGIRDVTWLADAAGAKSSHCELCGVNRRSSVA